MSRVIGSQLFSVFQQGEGGEGVGIDWFTGSGEMWEGEGRGGVKIDITLT